MYGVASPSFSTACLLTGSADRDCFNIFFSLLFDTSSFLPPILTLHLEKNKGSNKNRHWIRHGWRQERRQEEGEYGDEEVVVDGAVEEDDGVVPGKEDEDGEDNDEEDSWMKMEWN